MITKLGITLVAVSLLGTAQTYADGYQRWVEVVNTGEAAIWTIDITNVAEPIWSGIDVLGTNIIYPRSSEIVEPYDPRGYCRFDILVTYQDGTEVPVWNVNLCVEEKIFVNDMGYTQVGY